MVTTDDIRTESVNEKILLCREKSYFHANSKFINSCTTMHIHACVYVVMTYNVCIVGPISIRTERVNNILGRCLYPCEMLRSVYFFNQILLRNILCRYGLHYNDILMMSVLQEVKGLTKEIIILSRRKTSFMRHFRFIVHTVYLFLHRYGLHYNHQF